MIDRAQDIETIVLALIQNIPEELKTFNQWVAWRAVPRADGKISKVPVDPKNGANASTTNPNTWGSLSDARLYYLRNRDDGIAGIGFVFTPEDPFCGVDLDDCWNPAPQQIDNPFFAKILEELKSYSEVSPSGKGVKIFMKGKLPGPGRNLGNVEMYDSARFFTVTGQRIHGYPMSIEDRSSEISELYNRLTRRDRTTEDSENNSASLETFSIEALPVSDEIKRFIAEGVPVGGRSEATMKVLIALIKAGIGDSVLFKIFEDSPIGDKYREKGKSRASWLRGEIQRAKGFIDGKIPEGSPSQDDQGPGSPEEKRIITDLNNKHAVIMVGGRCLVMNEVFDPVFNRPDINFSTVTDFKHFYSNKKLVCQGGKKVVEEPYSDLWLNSPDRREYKGIVFTPGKDVPGYYNLFRGFALSPKPGDWGLFKKHILEVIAGGNKEVFEYLLAWMAQLVQKPGGGRPGTAIVLRGKQGTGKGCFATQFGRIFGTHFLHITNQKQLTGRFNSHLKDALLVFCDEGIWAGDKTAEGVLKGMVTEDLIMVEPKGKDPFPVKNHIRLIVASNNNWVIPAGLEERRFFALDVDDKYMQDKAYFKALFDQMDNGGREAMLKDLLEYELTGVDLRTILRTKALMDQIINSMNSVGKFWYDRLREGSLKTIEDDWTGKVESEALYEHYIMFAGKIGDRYKVSESQFGKEIKELCPAVDRKKIKKDNGQGRAYHLFFPSLEECRKLFEARVDIEIDWEV